MCLIWEQVRRKGGRITIVFASNDEAGCKSVALILSFAVSDDSRLLFAHVSATDDYDSFIFIMSKSGRQISCVMDPSSSISPSKEQHSEEQQRIAQHHTSKRQTIFMS